MNEINKIQVGTTPYDIVPDTIVIDGATNSVATINGNYNATSNKLITKNDLINITNTILG